MTILFAGGEFGAFTSTDAASFETVSGGTFDPDYARCSIDCDGPSTLLRSGTFSATSEGYIHSRSRNGNVTDNLLTAPGAIGVSAAGTEQFRMFHQAGTVRLQYVSGSAWVDATASIAITEQALNDFDLYFKVGTASGALRLYSNGSLLLDSGTKDLSAVTAITQVWFSGQLTVFDLQHSEVIVADEPTIGWRLGAFAIDADGSNTDWTGSFADIDEIVHSDADFISSDTAGQVSTFAGTALTGPSGQSFLIKGVVVAARAKRGSTGPQNLQLAVRTGAANFFSSTHALDVGYGAHVGIWETNPNTLAAWAAADLDTLEIGVKSLA